MTGPDSRLRVLVLCTHNSARSQMAEGLLRNMGRGRVDAWSAGTEETHVRELAIASMAEIGIDISGQESKTLDGFVEREFDYVVTVCDSARDACPVFPGARRRLHWPLPDPSGASGTREERLAAYRRVRDDLRERIAKLLASHSP